MVITVPFNQQRRAMTIIQALQDKFRKNEFEFSEHAVTQGISILVQELREVVQTAEILEDYPNDKYGQSVLILEFTSQQRPLHMQCSYPSCPLVKIITLYQPDPRKWINHRTRR